MPEIKLNKTNNTETNTNGVLPDLTNMSGATAEVHDVAKPTDTAKAPAEPRKMFQNKVLNGICIAVGIIFIGIIVFALI